MRLDPLLSILGIVIGQSPSAGTDKPVALVVVVRGDLQIEASGGKAARLTVDRRLSAGDRIVVPPGGSAVVILLDSARRQRLKPIVNGKTVAPSRITVTADGCTPARAVEEIPSRKVRISQDLRESRPLLPSARPGAIVARGADDGDRRPPPAIRPISDSVIIGCRPDFSWPARPAVRSYLVRLVDAAGTTIWERRTERPSLPYPADEKPLDLSRLYAWNVAARTSQDADVAVVVGAHFRTVPRSLEPTFREVRELSEGDDPADLFVSAIIFHHHGVRDEALRAFRRLATLMPGEPAVHAGLAECCWAAGSVDEARTAGRRAQALLPAIDRDRATP